MECERMNESNSFINWIKENKKLLIALSITTGAIVATAILCKKTDVFERLIKDVKLEGNNSIDDGGRRVVSSVANTVAEGTKGSAMVKDVVESTTKAVEESEKASKIVSIEPFFRKLPKNYNISPGKVAEAATKNIEIPDGMTYVNGFERSYKVRA